MEKTVKILLVCLGNICRSPLAEGVLRQVLSEHGLDGKVLVDSCGTGGWHAGELPDPRSRAIGLANGIRLTHRARKIEPADLEKFDLVLAMDWNNFQNIQLMEGAHQHASKLRMFRYFDPDTRDGDEVPDPYDGDMQDFEHVFHICLRTSKALVEHILQSGGINLRISSR